MDKILAALSTITNKITTIEMNQNEFSNKMTTLEKNQDGFSNRMTTLEKNQEGFSLDLKSLDEKVDTLKTSLVDDLEPYFANIVKHIDDNYNELSSKIGSQENTIKLLSSRSIQQEADTNALNKIVRNQ